MLGAIEGKRRRGRQRMRWLDGVTEAVLSRVCASRTRQARKDGVTYYMVEILGLNQQANVHREDVELLTEESITCIAANLVGQHGKGHDNVEEITYRRALREALNILQQAMPSKERSPSKTTRCKAATWKETKECAPGHWLPSSQNDTQEREVETGEAPTALQIMGTQNKHSRHSGGKAKGSSSAKSPRSRSRVLCRNGELKSLPQHASKAKMPVMPKEDAMLQLLSRAGARRRSPRSSKGYERHCQDEDAPSRCFARSSTPAPSSHKCAKSTPGKKLGGKLGLRRNLLGSPVQRPSAAAEKDLSEKEVFPPSKYSKDLDGERHPQAWKGTGQKQDPGVPSVCQERRCLKGSASRHDPAAPFLDNIQEESLCPCANEAKNLQPCDLEGKGLGFPSESALRLSPIRELCLSSAFGDEEEAEDEEELPSILLHQEPCSLEAGMLVWCKLRRYPYWPAMVKSVKRKAKKASVQLIEKCMDKKGFFISLRNLKHYDCEEQQRLIDKARESYQDEINWCINLIKDYRIRVGCHSFTGTILEYCADDMSYPVRKETHSNFSQMTLPQLEEVDSEEVSSETTPSKPSKKVLPDRTRAARDKANKKIVEFIVKEKGADEHLRAVLNSKKQSRWLKTFLEAPPCITSFETYLEDDDQMDLVVKYLQEVSREIAAEWLPLINGDSVKFTKFILDVLFPEAIIYAISAVDRIGYEEADKKYCKGPLLGQREKEVFEEGILEKKRKKRLQQLTPSPEASL
ncbi:PWWP domain-containing DNA repair factor 3A isoform X3 [Paroedura picta]|uniref:PWWP domain-containing DNA repair factor 3A isoform X3 n=1 Tax=Paroedura picta TaxID=143630 RepID=UPI004056DB2E